MNRSLRRLLVRGPRAASRWATLRRLRILYGHATFGDDCDIRPGSHVTIGDDAMVRFGRACVLDRGMTVEVEGALLVGDDVIFGHRCTLAAKDRIEIGDDCLIAEMVSIRDHDHETADVHTPVRLQGARMAPVVIGRNVWLASKVTVLKGVTIGDNAIVGAGAVVTKDLPENAIAVGVPAKIVGYRPDSTST
jgi:acetyltransferase-like isoleucine patch superfamily enzyme